LSITALNEDGTYRESVWYNVLGEDFIPLAFQYAAAADPYAQLYYNDYNLEYNGAKTDGAQRIVQLIQSRGLKINGVGFQAHMTSEPTPSSGGGVTPDQKTLSSALRKMTSQGVDVAYTEIDVRMNLPSTPAKLEVQADVYRRIAASCLAVKRCVGMTVWVSTIRYLPHPSRTNMTAGRLRQILLDPRRLRGRGQGQPLEPHLHEEASLLRLPQRHPDRRQVSLPPNIYHSRPTKAIYSSIQKMYTNCIVYTCKRTTEVSVMNIHRPLN
jgi:hypothetical protein